MNIRSEQTFETAIIQSLTEHGGYTEGDAKGYSPDLGMFKDEVLAFLKSTQPKRWAKLTEVHGAETENRILQRLHREMDLRGSLDVLRNGFTDYGVRFNLAFFRPVSGLNPETKVLYEKNPLTVVRQVYFSSKTSSRWIWSWCSTASRSPRWN